MGEVVDSSKFVSKERQNSGISRVHPEWKGSNRIDYSTIPTTTLHFFAYISNANHLSASQRSFFFVRPQKRAGNEKGVNSLVCLSVCLSVNMTFYILLCLFRCTRNIPPVSYTHLTLPTTPYV